MCGICGIYAYRAAAANADSDELRRIRDHMAARGPDGAGIWLSDDERVVLGHRRLSIIDLSERGAQPMSNADRTLAVTFNGEIYNYRELRQRLEVKGYVFRSESDTEVLLHLYADKGGAMVHELRGMFTFALWDVGKRALLLVRDPYGIKPLYYADDGYTLRFASQVKALLASGRISREPDAAGRVGFYLFGSVPEPWTSHAAIRALAAGSTLRIDGRGVAEPNRYFSIARAFRDAEHRPVSISTEEVQARVRGALLDSVRHHLVADVPVGAFLSAGIDSGALLGLMRDVGYQDIQTITLAFEEFQGRPDDESKLAAEAASRYVTRHATRVVTQREFRDDLPKILEAMDQPSIDGINIWFVSKAARELGLKVAISGLGGDELFGGYSSFRDIPRWVRLFAMPSRIPFAGEVFRALADAAVRHFPRMGPKSGGLVTYGGSYPGAYLLRRGLFMPWELQHVMPASLAAEGLERLRPAEHIAAMLMPAPRSGFAKVAVLEASIYMRNQLLRDTDWASMAHSLEVRVPLVDAALLRALAPIASMLATKPAKRWLAASPVVPLPHAVLNRAKTGFGTPVQTWLQQDDRLHQWRRVPSFTVTGYPWARRWAYQVGLASLS
jgi:asparagine synthase (glutamine-hydrolysing)